MIIFQWNAEKNKILAETRGITFEEIVQKIESGAVVVNTKHPNKKNIQTRK